MRKVLFVLLMAVMLLVPLDSYARTYSAHFDKATPEQVINTLKQETGLDIVCTKDLLKSAKSPVTCDFTGLTLDQLLNRVLSVNMQLGYEVVDNTVVIKRPDAAADRVKGEISGVVFDTDANEPLIGATITIDGTSDITVTDADGRFTFANVDVLNPVVSATFVGMKPASVKVTPGNQHDVRVNMETHVTMMSEVVVTGYQEVKKEKMTGATTTVSAEKLNQRFSTNVLDNLEGRVAGLSTYGGKPIIRGLGTLHGNTSPLLVVDGVPVESSLASFDPFSDESVSSDSGVGALADLNPYDIESINVLKDAAAAAIYGARAANGIIVVTTKNAKKKDKIDIDFSANLTVYENRNVDYADNFYMTPEQQVNAESNFYEWYLMSGDVPNATNTIWNRINRGDAGVSPIRYGYYQLATGQISRDELNSRLDALKNNNFAQEYADDVLRRQVVQQYNLALRTSSEKSRNNVTINYKHDNEGMIEHNNDWFNLSYKGSFDLAKWLTATVSFNGIYSTKKEAGTDLSADYTSMWALPAYMPYRNSDGSRRPLYYSYSGNEYWDEKGTDGFHDLGVIVGDELRNNSRTTKRSHMRYHADLLFKVLPGLTLNTQFVYEVESQNASWHATEQSHLSRTIRNAYTIYDDNGKIQYLTPRSGGMLRTTQTDGNYWTARAQANYSRTFLEKHDIAAIAGLEFRQTKLNGTKSLVLGYDEQLQSSATQTVDFNVLANDWRDNYFYMTNFGYGFPSASVALPYIYDGMGVIVEQKHRYASGYANLTYTYDERYNVFGSYRKDYADVYGLNARFRGQPLWSVGAGWNIHRESFMNDLTWANFLKLRFSYGATGNIYQGATSYMTAESTDLNDYTGLPIGSVISPANPNLRWEENRTTNAGLDFSFLNYRMRGSFDFYNKDGKNIFNYRALDPTTGFTSMFANVASIRNRGVELSLAYDWFVPGKSNGFSWTTEMTFSYNQNEVTKVNNPAASASALIATPYREGYPVNALWSYKFAGISDGTEGYEGQTLWYDENGDVRRSVSGRSIDVLEFSGQTDPKTIIGLNNSLRWNGLSLNVLMTYCGGHMMRALTESEQTYSLLMPYAPIRSYFLDAWTPENPTSHPGFGQYANDSDPASETAASNTSVHHADFIKIRNLVLGYDFPSSIVRRLGVNHLSLRFQVDNPGAIWTRNNIGVDPETLGIRNRTSYVFGLNINL
jgi:TonB-linked SusC/RagA family outer membrane protein